MTAEMKAKFDKAIQREVRNNNESGAYEILDRTASEHIRRTKADKIVQSRYVLTEKAMKRKMWRRPRRRVSKFQTMEMLARR